ncbi:hypothetical protein [Alkalicoccobacillus porphyridii]|uniref:Group-specific protein n=1 Tax=Alkalicoccobacillus porphyridii TaxID=2597270 RepID=A0A553ZYV8_9BACI|nr:hypothetical protein [Alkalicoccobacillus porphyridii]TSB46637.1 hypothetical protein FN960_09785 [Alkalicoccobacillus porphyridii]
MGMIISLIVALGFIILTILLARSVDRKYIVKKPNGDVDFAETSFYLRWNTLDTMNVCLSVYAVFCMVVLNILIMAEFTYEQALVQFFMSQSQAFVILVILNLCFRISRTLKSINARWGNASNEW